MRYLFDTVLEKNGEDYVAQVPFNVWEVAKQREEIDADLLVDNKIITCKLHPQEKGKYEMHMTGDAMSSISTGEQHKILLHVHGSLVPVKEGSPYSIDHPVRKIDGINVVLQKSDGLCGQACIAMLAGVTIQDVMDAIDCREWQGTMGRLISALNYYGLAHPDIVVYPSAGEEIKLPKCCIMMEKMGRFSHYLVHYDGKFYDPNLGVLDSYDFSKLLGYLEVQL